MATRSNVDIDGVCAAYQSGATMGQCAKQFAVSAEFISAVLYLKGVPIRQSGGFGGGTAGQALLTPDRVKERAECLALYEAKGKDATAEIMRRLHCTTGMGYAIALARRERQLAKYEALT